MRVRSLTVFLLLFGLALSSSVIGADDRGGRGDRPGDPGERPDRPDPCGAECHAAARDAMAACKESDDPEACMAAVREELAACLESLGCEIPERPDRPGPCGAECHAAARDAMAACKESDDPEACMAAVREELAACLESLGCEIPERPDRPGPCGAECHAAARDAMAACKESDDPEACMADERAQLAACLENLGCEPPKPPDRPDRPQSCLTRCREDASAAARECHENGGTREDCRAEYERVLGECTAADPECEVPDRPDRPDPPDACLVECMNNAAQAARECMRGGDADVRVCIIDFISALTACVEGDGCDPEALKSVLEAPFFVRGDANGDGGRLNISDAVFILRYLFASGPEPSCVDAADANDNGSVEISDAILLLTNLFQSGSMPIADPYPFAGVDPTPDDLLCEHTDL